MIIQLIIINIGFNSYISQLKKYRILCICIINNIIISYTYFVPLLSYNVNVDMGHYALLVLPVGRHIWFKKWDGVH